MPNHVHGILQIVHPPKSKAALLARKSEMPNVTSGLLSAIIRSFKSAVTRRAHLELHWTADIWQAKYFEHILRGGDDFANPTQYVVENPLCWLLDAENQDHASSSQLAKLGRSMLRPYEGESHR